MGYSNISSFERSSDISEYLAHLMEGDLGHDDLVKVRVIQCTPVGSIRTFGQLCRDTGYNPTEVREGLRSLVGLGRFRRTR